MVPDAVSVIPAASLVMFPVTFTSWLDVMSTVCDAPTVTCWLASVFNNILPVASNVPFAAVAKFKFKPAP